jgi:hypothetical protein
MSPRIQIIQRIEHNFERLEPCDVKLRVLDIIVVGLDLDLGVESAGRLLRDLRLGSVV